MSKSSDSAAEIKAKADAATTRVLARLAALSVGSPPDAFEVLSPVRLPEAQKAAFDPRKITAGGLPKPVPAVPTRADEALWFAPGADDLSLLPTRAQGFDEIYLSIVESGYPRIWHQRKHRRRKAHATDDQKYVDAVLEKRREQAAIVDHIRQEGFACSGGVLSNGHELPSFREIGDRTGVKAAHVIRRLASLLPVDLKAGTSKETVRRVPKRIGAYLDYVELDGRVRAVIRIDIDAVFENWDALWRLLARLFADGLIPLIPHFGCSYRDMSGRVVNPHLFVLLPVGDEVRFDGRCKSGARKLMRAVECGWIRALECIGADRGGASNSVRVKNALSPKMSIGIFNQTRYLRLGDMVKKLDCRPLDRDERQRAMEKAGVALDAQSQNAFTATKREAWQLVHALRVNKSPLFEEWMADRAKMANALYQHFVKDAIARYANRGRSSPEIASVVFSVCRHCARAFDPDLCSPLADRGAMAHLLDDRMSARQKRQRSGQWSSEQQVQKSIAAMADVVRSLEAAGQAVDKAALIASGVRARATVYRYYEQALSTARIIPNHESQPVVGKKVQYQKEQETEMGIAFATAQNRFLQGTCETDETKRSVHLRPVNGAESRKRNAVRPGIGVDHDRTGTVNKPRWSLMPRTARAK